MNKMNKLKINGYGSSLGRKVLHIKGQTRYRVDQNQDHFSLAVEAIEQALNRSDYSLEEMDALIFASAVGYQPIPCSAVLISEKLKPRKPIPCMDINTSCSSFIAALDTLSYLLQAGRYRRILIVSAEIPSLGLNEKQQESFELFSDAGAAFIFESTHEDSGVLFARQSTWSEGAHQTEIRGGLTSFPASEIQKHRPEDYLFDMKGREILFLTMNKIEQFWRDLQQESGFSLSDLDLIIPHQASKALGMVMKKLKIPPQKYIDRVKDYGNMVSVSVPFMLCRVLEEERLRRGQKVLLLGTAAGLTINGVILRI